MLCRSDKSFEGELNLVRCGQLCEHSSQKPRQTAGDTSQEWTSAAMLYLSHEPQAKLKNQWRFCAPSRHDPLVSVGSLVVNCFC
jgi:hypothetical protein